MRKVIYILLSIGIVTTALLALMSPKSHRTGTEIADYTLLSIEGYAYGNFDEIRIKQVYQVSDADDVFDLPVGDFEHNGQIYHLISIDQTDEADLDYSEKEKVDPNKNPIFYTATFGCMGTKSGIN